MTVTEFDQVLGGLVCSRRRNLVVSVVGGAAVTEAARLVCPCGRTEMRDPRLSSNIGPNMTISNEVILSNQFNSEDNPFAEYMWMENEEEFNRQVEEELWEEEFIERCIQELLEEEEQWEWFIPSRDLPLQDQSALLVLDTDIHADADFDVVINSSLNPNAKEFIPGIQKHIM